ncbi:hypothetical protein [Shewanella putrefaciens]|jgi:type V secretory pathway adhesin AidA|uniref:hypothetical protein n=1 Tax=Shewanella putrefaciens TaxID=24 RepID=UPI00242E6EF5|nr:hypothetical protein [Shewanella putrefaciens]MCA1896901.1 hypothetical protein [Shewanella putrefaciens]
MDQFSEYQKAIELLSLSDHPRQIMEGLGDICFDGESLYHNGNKALATHIFKHIYALDAHSDYFSHARTVAKAFLINLGEIPTISLEKTILQIQHEHASLATHQLNLLIAKRILREFSHHQDAIHITMHYLTKAEALAPLSKSDLRFKALVSSNKRE